MTAITPFHYSYVTGQWFNHYIGVSVGLTFINKTTCILSLMFWIIIGLLVYYYCALRKLLGYCGWYMTVIKVLRPLPSRFVAKCLISCPLLLHKQLIASLFMNPAIYPLRTWPSLKDEDVTCQPIFSRDCISSADEFDFNHSISTKGH